MDSNAFLKLADFFVSFSDTQDNVSLRVWKDGGLFKFHLTNNHQPQNSFISQTKDSRKIFSTPNHPNSSPERSVALNNLHHHPTVVPSSASDTSDVEDKQDDLPEEGRLVEEEDVTQSEHDVRDEQPPEFSQDICDHEPMNNPDLYPNGYPIRGQYDSAIFSPCDHSGLGSNHCSMGSPKSGCPLCHQLIKKENLKYICGTHKNHWHERSDSCSRKLRVSNEFYCSFGGR